MLVVLDTKGIGTVSSDCGTVDGRLNSSFDDRISNTGRRRDLREILRIDVLKGQSPRSNPVREKKTGGDRKRTLIICIYALRKNFLTQQFNQTIESKQGESLHVLFVGKSAVHIEGIGRLFRNRDRGYFYEGSLIKDSMSSFFKFRAEFVTEKWNGLDKANDLR